MEECTPLGEALCCDVTLLSPLTREGRPQPSAASRDGATITVAERGASALPTLNCYGRGRSDSVSSPVKLEDLGVLSRFASSLNSCASEPSALLPPCALRLGRVGAS